MYADLNWRLAADRQSRLRRDFRRWNDRTSPRRGATDYLAERASLSGRATAKD